MNSELEKRLDELIDYYLSQIPFQTLGRRWELELRKGFKAKLTALIQEAAKVTGDTSDGYHTFNELYEFRKAYNALLFNEWAAQHKYNVYKSKLHSDGTLPFGGGWFVVGAKLPTGQITNHYELKDWDLFVVPELPRASEWDGHSPQEALTRLLVLAAARPKQGGGTDE